MAAMRAASVCDGDAAASTVAVALRKVVAYAAQRRVRFDDFFSDYDKLRTGCVTANQFVRVLTMHHVPLDADEMTALAAAFAPPPRAAATSRHATHGSGSGKDDDSAHTSTVSYADFVRALQPMHELTHAFALHTTAATASPLAQPRSLPRQQQQQQHSTLLPPPSQQRQPCRLSDEEEAQLRPVMGALQHAVRTRGIHVIASFRDFDALHTGKVTAAQFVRGVSSVAAGCAAGGTSWQTALQPDGTVVQRWLRKYGDGQGSVYYALWCRDVDAGGGVRAAASATAAVARGDNNSVDGGVAKTTATTTAVQQQQQQQEGRVADAASTTSFAAWVLPASHASGAAAMTMSTYTNATLDAAALMHILRRQCARYKLRCDDYLVDFDVYKSGTVSAAQFASALGRLRLVRFALTHENVQTLCDAYATTTTTTTTAMTATAAATSLSPYEDNNADTSARRVDYRRFLHDLHAPATARDGDVDDNDDDKDVCEADEHNHNHHSEDGGTLPHVSLLASRAPPADAGAHTAAAATTMTAAAAAAMPTQEPRHSVHNFLTTPAEQQAAEQVLAKVRRLVASNRIFLSPVFRDFDRVRTAIHAHRTCTSSRFARGLVTQKVCLSPSELQLLIRKYTVPHCDGSASDEVDYYAFVHDVDASLTRPVAAAATSTHIATTMQQQQQQGVRTDTQGSKDEPTTSLDAVLQTLAQQCALRELRLADVCSDFDRLRAGVMPASKLATALSMAGVHVSAEALQCLCRAYHSDKVPGDLVDTQRLLRDVGARAPHVVPTPHRPPLVLPPLSSTLSAITTTPNATATAAASTATLSDEEQTLLSRVLRRLRHETRTRGALLTPFFADFDRSNCGKVTPACFTQALARHAFVLSEAEVSLLCAWYAVQQGGMTMCDYRRFVRDIDVHDGCTTTAARDTNTSPLLATTTTTRHGAMSGTRVDDQSTATRPPPTDADVEAVLAKVCAYVRQRRPRVHEFFGDGDELRHGRVSAARFRHCLAVLGLTLRAEELTTLESAFAVRSGGGVVVGEDDNGGKMDVDYPAFVHTVRTLLADGLDTRTLSRGVGGGGSNSSSSGDKPLLQQSDTRMAADDADNNNNNNDVDSSDATSSSRLLLRRTLQKVRRTLASRRAVALPAFRECDRARKGHVTESQFFTCLLALGVQLTPQEAAALRDAYALLSSCSNTSSGEVAYEDFARAVDDAALVART